jgi:Zn-finger nucleic acid-binding protein
VQNLAEETGFFELALYRLNLYGRNFVQRWIVQIVNKFPGIDIIDPTLDQACCPSDGGVFQVVSIDAGSAGVCRECRGIWLPGVLIRTLKAEFRGAYVPYSTLPEAPFVAGRCPTDQRVMAAFKYCFDAVEWCRECGGLWLPGSVLHLLHDRARQRAGKFKPFPSAAEGRLIGPVSVVAGFDPSAVDDLLTASIGIWVF